MTNRKEKEKKKTPHCTNTHRQMRNMWLITIAVRDKNAITFLNVWIWIDSIFDIILRFFFPLFLYRTIWHNNDADKIVVLVWANEVKCILFYTKFILDQIFKKKVFARNVNKPSFANRNILGFVIWPKN